MLVEFQHRDDEFRSWIASRPMAVLVNAAVLPSPTRRDVPAEMLARIGARRLDFMVFSQEQVEAVGIVLSHDQRKRFERGEPILLSIGGVEHRDRLPRGRRKKSDLENDVQQALSIAVYIGVERLAEWVARRDGRRLQLTLPERRERAFGFLSAGPVEERSTGLADRTQAGADGSFWRTAYDDGGRRIAGWYAGVDRPGELARRAREAVVQMVSVMDRLTVDAMIEDEVERLIFLRRCLDRATGITLAAHEVTVTVKQTSAMSKGQQACLAGHQISEHPSLFDAVRAALDGDFDVSALFPSLVSYASTIELARVIGRHGRGHAVRLEGELIRELRHAFERHDRLQTSLGDPGGQVDEDLASSWIVRAAGEIYGRDRWLEALGEAEAYEGAIVLTGRADRVAA